MLWWLQVLFASGEPKVFCSGFIIPTWKFHWFNKWVQSIPLIYQSNFTDSQLKTYSCCHQWIVTANQWPFTDSGSESSLKNTVLRKTRLKVQIRLPPIKFWLTVNLLSATYSTLYLDAIYAKKIRFFESVTRDDPLKSKKLFLDWETTFILLWLKKCSLNQVFRD